jgi:hypothetical protein
VSKRHALQISPAIYNDICHSLNPVAFARDRLGFNPDPRQALVLASRAKQIILNCTRQWGKSTVTAARAVFTAWHEPESLILVLSPARSFGGHKRVSRY